jgi:hypothetical protein
MRPAWVVGIIMLTVVVTAAVITALLRPDLLGFGRSNHDVTFAASIQNENGTMSVTWAVGDQGATQPNTGGPWSWTVPGIPRGTRVALHVQNNEESPFVRCSIAVDGKEIAGQERAGPYAEVMCEGTVR